MSKRCIVFDIDDTLYLERDYVKSGFTAVGAFLQDSRGISGFETAAWEYFEQGGRGDIFNVALERIGASFDGVLIRRLVQEYRCHEPDIALLDDARECIEGLSGEVLMAAITDGPLESQRAKARALGLERWMSPVICTGAYGAGFGKPHVRAYEEVVATLGVAHGDCTYVADNPAKDFVAPRALGWRTVRVRRVGGLHFDVVSGVDVDLVVEELGGAFV